MESESDLALGKDTEATIGEYLAREGYSDSFRDNMLIVRSFSILICVDCASYVALANDGGFV